MFKLEVSLYSILSYRFVGIFLFLILGSKATIITLASAGCNMLPNLASREQVRILILNQTTKQIIIIIIIIITMIVLVYIVYGESS